MRCEVDGTRSYGSRRSGLPVATANGRKHGRVVAGESGGTERFGAGRLRRAVRGVPDEDAVKRTVFPTLRPTRRARRRRR